MKNYFSKMGDRSYAWHFLTKREVYQKMCADLSDEGIKEIISMSTFYELWDGEYSHVLIPEVCSECMMEAVSSVMLFAIVCIAFRYDGGQFCTG